VPNGHRHADWPDRFDRTVDRSLGTRTSPGGIDRSIDDICEATEQIQQFVIGRAISGLRVE
jgi:hypothetical protein